MKQNKLMLNNLKKMLMKINLFNNKELTNKI